MVSVVFLETITGIEGFMQRDTFESWLKDG
jgi:hypothetical protein